MDTDVASLSVMRGPGAGTVVLTINGQVRELPIEPRVSLLDALREHLGLTGSKKGCDQGTCGGLHGVGGRPAGAGLLPDTWPSPSTPPMTTRRHQGNTAGPGASQRQLGPFDEEDWPPGSQARVPVRAFHGRDWPSGARLWMQAVMRRPAWCFGWASSRAEEVIPDVD
jgi:hypothetical protein